MNWQQDPKARKRVVCILRVLQQARKSLGASRLARDLEALGTDMSQRTVRYYLAMMDSAGLTRSCGKRGREITPAGEQELAKSFVAEKVGLVAAKVDELAYQMTFQLRRARGTIILNISTVPAGRMEEAAREGRSPTGVGSPLAPIPASEAETILAPVRTAVTRLRQLVEELAPAELSALERPQSPDNTRVWLSNLLERVRVAVDDLRPRAMSRYGVCQPGEAALLDRAHGEVLSLLHVARSHLDAAIADCAASPGEGE